MIEVTDKKHGVKKMMSERFAKVLTQVNPQRYMTRDMRAASPVRVESPAGEELDANGEAWDPEQHSDGRRKKADGTWVKRPGRRIVSE